MSDEHANVECRIMRNGGGCWYWEVIHVVRTVVMRGIAEAEPAARQEADEAARQIKLIP